MYSTVSDRVLKPFNPVLGETYELDREDEYGWRLISEQVSHHPPQMAQYVESKRGWKLYEQLKLESSIGKYVHAYTVSYCRIDFDNGCTYTFNRPAFNVHNVIIGKMYVDIVNDIEITGYNKASGWKAQYTFVPQTFFSMEPQRIVRGKIIDPMNNVKHTINAIWNKFFEVAKVTSVTKKNDFNTEKPVILWKKSPLVPESQLYYNFTVFACQLNEMENGVPPTDSRLRPDQRLMENGDWDESNREKFRIEEIQRDRRRKGEDVQPLWFSKQYEEFSSEPVWKYGGKYWKCKEQKDWSQCAKLW
jgi:oxysterol-binding protein 1